MERDLHKARELTVTLAGQKHQQQPSRDSLTVNETELLTV